MGRVDEQGGRTGRTNGADEQADEQGGRTGLTDRPDRRMGVVWMGPAVRGGGVGWDRPGCGAGW